MIDPTLLGSLVTPVEFMSRALKTTTSGETEALLAQLPIASERDYTWTEDNPSYGWQPGKLHWVPVGLDRGNAGRIKQANQPVSPIAERTVNGMEALIELARQRELLSSSSAPAPMSPRDAVKRYYGLPPLDQLPKLDTSAASKAVRVRARDLARQLRVRLLWDNPRAVEPH